MSKPWMPLYVADYLADTAHLGAAESGAYLHLIMHYWLNGGLPDNDKQLARIARLTDLQWRSTKGIVAAFFHDGWKHKRIDEEIARAADISSKRRASAEQRHSKNHANADAIAEQKHTHARASSPSQSQRKEDAADAAPVTTEEADLFRRGKAVLGPSAGGLIKQLLAAKDKNVALARAAIETAATKENPREYIGGVLRGATDIRQTVDPRL